MNTTKTVFVFPSWYPPDGGSFFKEQTEVLAEMSHQIVLYPREVSIKKIMKAPMRELASMCRIEHESDCNIHILRVTYIRVPKSLRFRLYLQYLFFSLLYKRACRLYGKPDVIHVHSAIWAGYSAYLIGGKRKIPYIITEHRGRFVDNDYANAKKQLPERFRKYLIKIFSNAAFIAPVSESMIPKIYSYLEKEVEVESRPNLINTKIFDNQDVCHNKADQFTFISVCGLTDTKGVDILIKAFAQALEKSKIISSLVIVGDGPDRKLLEELAVELKIENKVIFKGHRSREEVGRLLMQSHVFALPTRYEAFGVVFGEALAAGLPVLATRGSGGPDSIVTPGVNGYLFDIDNIAQLADLMIKVYKNYHQWDFSEIAKSAHKKYGKETFKRSYRQLFDRVC